MEQTVILELWADQNRPLEIYVEPLPDKYVLAPGQKAILATDISTSEADRHYTVSWHVNGVTVFPPDPPGPWTETRVICDGVRLVPWQENEEP